MSRATMSQSLSGRNRLNYLLAAWGLTASIIAARSAVPVPAISPAAESRPIIIPRQSRSLPIEYYLTDSEAHAVRIRDLFTAVNDVRRNSGEPPIRVVVLDRSVTEESFRLLVDPLPEAPSGSPPRVVLHDTRFSCGVCEPDPLY